MNHFVMIILYLVVKNPCYATRLIHKGVPIDVVSRSMGHSKVSMTCDVYLHKEKRMSSIHFPRLFS